MDKKENKRRNFLQTFLMSVSGIILTSSTTVKSESKSNDKVKMLTPDGKLVEIEKSKIELENIPERASNKDILNWMNSGK